MKHQLKDSIIDTDFIYEITNVISDPNLIILSFNIKFKNGDVKTVTVDTNCWIANDKATEKTKLDSYVKGVRDFRTRNEVIDSEVFKEAITNIRTMRKKLIDVWCNEKQYNE